MKKTNNKKYAGCCNMFGPIGDDIKGRLDSFFKNPDEATWDDVSGIIIGGDGHTTFWQAVIAVDPSFPKRASLRDPLPDEPPFSIWERIPDEFTARRALEYAKTLNTK
ncbi:MAG: hypothetical protein JW885_02505 [Deltaproteobacteria bacterium]|nr:hypothetical protein [Candidatus Zymogenaceae bacterium]